LQKYGVNDDKAGWIFSDESFLYSGLKAIPLFVIPAKAGTQIRNVPVDTVSSEFSPFLFVRVSLDLGFCGDDKMETSSERFESQDREKCTPSIRT